jgi:hypothetical protein
MRSKICHQQNDLSGLHCVNCTGKCTGQKLSLVCWSISSHTNSSRSFALGRFYVLLDPRQNGRHC